MDNVFCVDIDTLTAITLVHHMNLNRVFILPLFSHISLRNNICQLERLTFANLNPIFLSSNTFWSNRDVR
jgi:hypothetical protein